MVSRCSAGPPRNIWLARTQENLALEHPYPVVHCQCGARGGGVFAVSVAQAICRNRTASADGPARPDPLDDWTAGHCRTPGATLLMARHRTIVEAAPGTVRSYHEDDRFWFARCPASHRARRVPRRRPGQPSLVCAVLRLWRRYELRLHLLPAVHDDGGPRHRRMVRSEPGVSGLRRAARATTAVITSRPAGV